VPSYLLIRSPELFPKLKYINIFYFASPQYYIYTFNIVVISYQASYDPNIKAERYKRFLFTFRVEVSHRGFVSWFRIVVSRRHCKHRQLFEIASTTIRDTRELYAINIRVR